MNLQLSEPYSEGKMVSSLYSRKRAYERIPVHIEINYIYNNESYSGTITNLSINGMFIEADQALPIRSRVNELNPFKSYCIVYVPFRGRNLKTIVNVRRLVNADSDYKCMGVELVNPSQDYLEFVSSIRNYCLVKAPCQSLAQLKNRAT